MGRGVLYWEERLPSWSFLFWAVVSLLLLGPMVAGAQVPVAPLRAASGIAYDSNGNLYIADGASNRIWEATLGGALVPIAGTGVQGFAGDGGPALSAELNEPQGLAFGSDGTLYIADTGNQRIRAISPAGVISTLAGTGTAGNGGDGGAATSASLRGPRGVAVDRAGAVLVCDTGNHRVRRIAAGLITAFAGSGVQGFAGDGGSASAAELNAPSGLAVSPDGRVFVADAGNERVRVVDASGGIATFAGNGRKGFGGDGGAAIDAMLSSPRALAWTPEGSLLIADEGNQRVRSIDAAGVIATVTGSGIEGGSADGANALQAAMRAPRALAMSSFGLPVVADTLNGTVRELAAAKALYQPAALVSGRISTVIAGVDGPITYGSSENVTVRVEASTPVPPEGVIQVIEGSTVLGSMNLSAALAMLPMSGLSAGSHTLNVRYLGDGVNPASVSQGVSVAVAPLTLLATADSSQAVYGAPLPALTGQIAGVLPQDVGQVQATFSAAAGAMPTAGTYPLTATLTGTQAGNYTVVVSPSSGTLRVSKAGTRAALGTISGGFAGMPLALSASVGSSTSGQPTGTVEFLDGTTVVAQAAVAGGQATATYPAAPLGIRSLAAQYMGDSNYLPSTSAVMPVAIAAIPDFTLQSTGSQGSTAAGGTATFNLLLSAQPGPFTGAIALSATGFPPGASVSFSPPQVIPGSATVPVVMTVQTKASSTAFLLRRENQVRAASLTFGALILLLGLGRRRRLTMSLLAITLSLTGCGARTVGEAVGGLVSQTYTLQVTGTATNLAGAVVVHTTSVALTVQQ